jgi:aquaporin related protein
MRQNPAVSLGLCLVGGITPVRAVILVISQIAGAIAGCALVQGLLGNMFARTTLKAGVSVARGLFLEVSLSRDLKRYAVLD